MLDAAIWRALHNGDARPFYKSKPWRVARRKAIIRAGHRCDRKQGGCGKPVNVPGEPAMVDHIKQLKAHPELALVDANLRVLCGSCHNKRHGRDRAPSTAQGADINGWPLGPDHPWNRGNRA